MEAEFSVPIRSRFFKVMVPGFNHQLNLPRAFCKKLEEEEEKLDEQAIIRTTMGTSKIQVSRDDESGLISFQDGWPDFVSRHGLSLGDFVVFEHTGDFHFNAMVFDASACEKDCFLADDPENDPQDNSSTYSTETSREEADETAGSEKRKNPSFDITMMPYHGRKYTQVRVPGSFWRSIGVRDTTEVIIRDPQGRKWRMRLHVGASRMSVSFRVGKGWSDFYEGNELKLGDVCTFEFMEKKSRNVVVLNVHIFPAAAHS